MSDRIRLEITAVASDVTALLSKTREPTRARDIAGALGSLVSAVHYLAQAEIIRASFGSDEFSFTCARKNVESASRALRQLGAQEDVFLTAAQRAMRAILSRESQLGLRDHGSTGS